MTPAFLQQGPNKSSSFGPLSPIGWLVKEIIINHYGCQVSEKHQIGAAEFHTLG